MQGLETSLKLGLLDGGVVGSVGYTYVDPQDLTQHDILDTAPATCSTPAPPDASAPSA